MEVKVIMQSFRAIYRKWGRLGLLCLLLLVLSACGLEVGIEGPATPDLEATATVEALHTQNAALATEVASSPVTATPAPLKPDADVSTQEVPDRPNSGGEGASTPAASKPSALHVAFFKGSSLWLWVEGQGAAPLMETDAQGAVKISDDGTRVAYVRGDGSLWAVNSDGSDPRQLVSAADFAAMEPTNPGVVLYHFDWVPASHALAYNTQLRTEVGLMLTDDLHLVDADSLEGTMLLRPGEGGEFVYSPDGAQIAIVTAESISLVDADGGNRRPVHTYQPVVTYSQFQFYARPVWAADSSSLRVAIPPADPQAEPSALTSLWYLPTDGTSSRLVGNIMVAPNSRPLFSPDLGHVLHLAGEGSLLVTDLGTGQTEPYQSGVEDLLGWSPDSRYFAFLTFPGGEPQTQIGGLYAPSVPAFSDAEAASIDLQWVGAYHYLFLTNSPGTWEIRLGEVGGASTPVALDVAGPTAYDFTGSLSQAAQSATVVAALTPTPAPVTLNPAVGALRVSTGRAMGLSADGRYVVIESTSVDLVDTPMAPDIPRIYLYDRETEEVTLVSATRGGAPADFWSIQAAISADGSTVAFWSFAGNLAGEGVQDCPDLEPGDPCGSLYLYDVPSGALERVPVGAGYGLGMTFDTALSADGRLVGFAAESGAIRSGVLLLDRSSGGVSQISATGVAVDLSADGRFVTFVSPEDRLVPDDANGVFDVFVLDRESGEIERISRPLEGGVDDRPSGASFAGEGISANVDISPDGRCVVFASEATSLVAAEFAPCTLIPGQELPACRHVYLYDRETGATELISISEDGTPGDNPSSGGGVSADGRWVVFTTLAGNLTPYGPMTCEGFGEVNCGQVLLRDRATGRTHLVSVAYDGGLPNSGSYGGRIAPDGGIVVFTSDADNLVPGVRGGLFAADLSLLIAEE
jgi:Tol biopolymer transport system component